MVWTAPDWMEQYREMFTDLIDPSLAVTMEHYEACCSYMMSNNIGRSIATNAQVAMLVKLRAQGLLKDVPACPLDQPDKEEMK